ncbi:MAG: chemotaxis protein CheC [Wujia sp.]|nr:chemotaxis protein CheC [Wujia sp.]MDD7284082.1 chemotaxis protein CheC [Clostridium sp.]MDY3727405.1 chemotaxis protein CheC [Wujia sp.]
MGNSKEQLSEQVKNALTELGNIGAGNATTSLSVLLSSRLTMTAPIVKLYDFNELENALGGPETSVVGVLSRLNGPINAMILFVLGLDDAKNLASVMLGTELEWHGDMGISAIGEIANILIGSYVASLGNLSGMELRYSQPQICIDMAGAILSVPCIEYGMISDKALLINSGFKTGNQEINGYIMLISEMHSFDQLLQKLGIGGAGGE